MDDPLDWIADAEYVDGDGEYRPAFIVDTDEKAAWALRKYASATERVSQATDLAVSEQQRISDWVEERKRILGRDVEFFGGLLERYALEQREQHDRKKIDLPDGVVQTRSTNEKFSVVDRDAFLAWAQQNRPDLLKVSYAPSMTALNDALAKAGTGAVDLATGAVVPGVAVEPGRVTATIKTN